MNIKLGHQAPIGVRVNTCQDITVDGRFKYNPKYNLVYDHKKESYKLHQGQACYFTDARFNALSEQQFSYINDELTFLNLDCEGKNISHKAAIRKILRCKGFPVNTLVTFHKSWKYKKHQFLDNSFIFKIKKDNPVSYNITEPSFFANVTLCDKAQELVVALRSNGFLVSVIKNTLDDYTEWQEVAIAYGYGKKVGFSPIGMPVQHCYYGLDRVLWDTYENFGTWSRCNYIPMSLPTENIVSVLLRDCKEDLNWTTLTKR